MCYTSKLYYSYYNEKTSLAFPCPAIYPTHKPTIWIRESVLRMELRWRSQFYYSHPSPYRTSNIQEINPFILQNKSNITSTKWRQEYTKASILKAQFMGWLYGKACSYLGEKSGFITGSKYGRVNLLSPLDKVCLEGLVPASLSIQMCLTIWIVSGLLTKPHL